MPFMTVWYRFTKSGSEVFHNNAFPASHGAVVPFLYHGFFLSTLLKHKSFYIKIQFSKFNIILYLIFDYPHKHYTFKYFEV